MSFKCPTTPRSHAPAATCRSKKCGLPVASSIVATSAAVAQSRSNYCANGSRLNPSIRCGCMRCEERDASACLVHPAGSQCSTSPCPIERKFNVDVCQHCHFIWFDVHEL